jgi:nuclear pore complex protein Nup188
VSEGLIKGAVMSLFGTRQANREVWDQDAECQRLSTRVRDLVLLIAIESLCLAQIVSPEAEDDNTFGATLIHSRDNIHAVHQFILEYSEELSEAHQPEAGVFPEWPIAVLCLGWAIVLRSLPPNLQPPSKDYFHLDTSDMDSAEITSFIDMANRALRISSGLFPWLEAILVGPLYETSKDAFSGDLADDMAALRRSPFKDLLIGLADLLRIDNIQDRFGLYRAWELLFGGGSRAASTSLSANYWAVDFVFDNRRAILDQSMFPREPLNLSGILAALTGVSSDDEIVLGDATTHTVTDVYQYFSDLPFVTFVAPPGTFNFDGRDDGYYAVEAAYDIELPGGNIIPRRTRGVVRSDADEEDTVISWRFKQPAWPLLLEILRGAAGLVHKRSNRPGVRRLTLEELGVRGALPEILRSGLKFLRCVLRSTDAAEHLAAGQNGSFGRAVLELALDVAGRRDDPVAARFAIDILESLLLTGASDIWQHFRGSGFFDSASRRLGSVAQLIQNDAMRGEHGLTITLLRLVRSLASANAGDSLVVRSAVKLVYSEVWSQFSGWRYRDVSKRYEIAALLLAIFDNVLSHPLGEDASSPSPAAAFLIDVFVKSASPLTYKPLVDVLTQSSQLVTKLIQSRRWSDANAVSFTFDNAASLLATLVRLAPSLNVAAGALPYSIFASTVVLPGGNRIQLADRLFDLIADPSMQTTSLRLVLRLVRVYLLTTHTGAQRPSLAGMLRRADSSIDKLADLAFTSAAEDVKPDAWALLGTIIRTQPGCAAFCIGPKGDKVAGPLKMAVDEVAGWKALMNDAPRALAAVLGYLQAVLDSSSASKGVAALRKEDAFWQGVYDVSIKNVPKPSSLAEDVVQRVQDYAYAVQSKANASGLLAAELALILESDGPETKALSLVLSLFRNTSALEDVATGAVRTTCDPELHANEAAALTEDGVQIVRQRTICLPDEREYGVQYLYDGPPVILNDHEKQAAVNRSLAILNLNWSQLDADIALTKAWRLLAEIASEWTQGDDLCAKASLRAAAVVSHELAEEDRGGDVMLAIQTERLAILAVLLDVALPPEKEATEPDVVKELAKSVRRIVEAPLFNPLVSLRHPELPCIHRPVLRVLLLLSQAKTGAAQDDVSEVLFDAGASFALDAADCILDWIVRGRAAAEADLGLVVALLCQMGRAPLGVWLDKLMQVNLIPRSLELIVRTRPVDGVLPPHFHTILLLHLAIASKTPTAEKLAVSGVLQAYSDNVVAVAAEAASIDPSKDESLHRAWCGMLLTVKALLGSLGGSFARSDVVPWVRVVLPQMLRALEWHEAPLSRPALTEMGLVADVFYGLADTAGAGLLDDFTPAALGLLRGVRYALSHPHRFATLVVPESEEEHAALEKELEAIETQKDEVNLVDARTPVVAAATRGLVDAARSILAALVRFTRAFALLAGDVEPQPELLLPYDDDAMVSASSDPIGAINDVFLLLRGLVDKLQGADRAPAEQGAEAAALLAVTQLLGRRTLHPDRAEMDVDVPEKRRSSIADRSGSVLRELQGDVRSMLPAGAGLLGYLRGIAESEFGDA